jgi:osmotically-inducible protein OsmY
LLLKHNKFEYSQSSRSLCTDKMGDTMNSLLKFGATLTLLAAMTAVSGCAGTGYSGTGGDTTVMEDLLTERRIAREIFKETRLSGSNIYVGCLDGVVTLSGHVETSVEADLAEKVARSIDGVTSVNNNLTTS